MSKLLTPPAGRIEVAAGRVSRALSSAPAGEAMRALEAETLY